VEAFFAWCEAEQGRVLDESPVADAIRYAINQKAALMRFLDDGTGEEEAFIAHEIGLQADHARFLGIDDLQAQA